MWSGQGRRTSGTWSEVFGDDWQADEVFMAWTFASYVETLAAAGKTEKALPMYVNAWLGPQPGQPRAGDYPSGGPADRVIDVWKAGAPSLDPVGPDIYVPDVKAVLADYARPDNPLFVPEARFRTGSPFWALGHHRAIGFSVFGIEDGRQDSQLARAYALLAPMQDVITAAQADGRNRWHPARRRAARGDVRAGELRDHCPRRATCGRPDAVGRRRDHPAGSSPTAQ